MHHLLFKLKSSFTLELAEAEIASLGGKEIYVIEDFIDQSHTLGAFFPDKPINFYSVDVLSEEAPFAVDWEKEWGQNTALSAKGCLPISLEEYKPHTNPIELIPGEGFGDLTHPTTRLMLRLMGPLIVGQPVIDIGCGSGILSVAAMQMGAQEVFAIDIDEKALEHTKKNSLLNNFESKIFVLNSIENRNFSSQPLILMNMISNEQEAAWGSVPNLHSSGCRILTSGILKSQKKEYLKNVTINRNWTLVQEIVEDEWVAFHFLINK